MKKLVVILSLVLVSLVGFSQTSNKTVNYCINDYVNKIKNDLNNPKSFSFSSIKENDVVTKELAKQYLNAIVTFDSEVIKCKELLGKTGNSVEDTKNHINRTKTLINDINNNLVDVYCYNFRAKNQYNALVKAYFIISYDSRIDEVRILNEQYNGVK